MAAKPLDREPVGLNLTLPLAVLHLLSFWAAYMLNTFGIMLLSLTIGAEPIRLPTNPSLSPNGATVAFGWRGDIWLASTAGGVARQLTYNPANDRSPCFSPDGKRIAFVSDREGAPQIFIIPADGGNPRQATFHTSGSTLEGWFPDGKSVLASAVRDHFWAQPHRFFQIELEKRVAEKLLFDDYGREGVVSPDGKQLLFVREGPAWWRKGYRGSQAARIWLFSIATGKFELLLDKDSGCRSPLWKPDGSGFYYCGAQNGAFNLREYDLKTKSDRALTDFDDDFVVQPTLSRDGGTAVFRRLFDLYRLKIGANSAPEKIELVASADVERPKIERRTLQTASQVAFTKDGLQIAFASGGDLWVMDTELREPKQITNTPEEERDPVFSPDGSTLAYVSDRDGKTDLYLAKRNNPGAYWWQNDSFKSERLTNDEVVEENPSYSPDGKTLAVIKGLGDLWLMSSDGSKPRRIFESWNTPKFDWSPDGKWIVFAYADSDFNRDIWLMPVDGSRPPFNLSRNPDNDDNPIWSPDGRSIAFVGSRYRKETDIFYVHLRKEDEDRTDRERTLEKALEKMRKGPTAAPRTGPMATPGAGAVGAPAAKQGGGRRRRPDGDAAWQPDPKSKRSPAASKTADEQGKPAAAAPPKAPVEVKIDFERIHERIHKISIPNSFETNLVWSPDSKKLAFAATIDGKRGTYTVEILSNPRPQAVGSAVMAQGRWIEPGNQIVGLISSAAQGDGDPNNPNPGPAPSSADSPWHSAGEQIGLEAIQSSGRGMPGAMSMAGGNVTSYALRCYQSIDAPRRARAVFDACWRTMRDIWYDEKLNGRDWNAVRGKYAPIAEQAGDMESVVTLVQMMLGELNGSHLGFLAGGGGPAFAGARGSAWPVVTPHLGIRFDPSFAGPGLKIRDVIVGGPADKAKLGIQAGDVVVAIQGVPVDSTTDLATIINGPADREVSLRFRNAAGAERTVAYRPTSFGAIARLLYEMWLADTRKRVDALSGGTLGYLPIRAMSQPEFLRFEDELYSVAAGKKGLLIDVRENGGGSTADHLLTALCQPQHAITVPRGGSQGYPQDRMIYTVWNKPVAVLCNQNSFSNAEIFSHAIKSLGRGKLIGVPTAGGVISTGAKTIMEVGRLRIPFRGWFGIKDGEDMELHGAVPDFVVWPQPGDMPAGKDAQLEKAVLVLLGDVRQWEERPKPKLIKASQRPAKPD